MMRLKLNERIFAYGVFIFMATGLLILAQFQMLERPSSPSVRSEPVIDSNNKLQASSKNLELSEEQKLHDVNRIRQRIGPPGIQPKARRFRKPNALKDLKLKPTNLDRNKSIVPNDIYKHEDGKFNEYVKRQLLPDSDKQFRKQTPRSRPNEQLHQGNNPAESGIVAQVKMPQQQPLDLAELAMVKNEADDLVKRTGYKKYAFNLLVSNRIGERREIPDSRHKLCYAEVYPTELPKSSIIICFYNEAPSALIRMVNSIVDRTPDALIQEILLVDDFSDAGYGLEEIRTYADANWLNKPNSKIRLLRTTQREGLIRAKVWGSYKAKGDVVVFLDSHCEVNENWLQPLVSRIVEDPKTVACPIIDIIDSDTFKYTASPVCMGGFSWSLFFKWDYPPHTYFRTPRDYIKPLKSATMAGGLFAIRRDYFHELGDYDGGMEVWGAENVEISFRIWMCGGRLEIIPCSRVGHIFRRQRPYGAPSGKDTMALNSVRTARVWMDQYLEKFYAERPHLRNFEAGDVSKRVALRQKLKCESFQWYLENVYPELLNGTAPNNDADRKMQAFKNDNPDRDGDLKVPLTKRAVLLHSYTLPDQCLCAPTEEPNKGDYVSLCSCKQVANIQRKWTETNNRELRIGPKLCLDAEKGARLMKCYGSQNAFQEWVWQGTTKQQLFNLASGQCLAVKPVRESAEAHSLAGVEMTICRADDENQWWNADDVTHNLEMQGDNRI